MSISFTGLGNIKVLKSEKQTEGIFKSVNNELMPGELKITEIKLRFNLTNDAKGNDMDKFQRALKESGRGYSYNAQTPDTVELHLKNVIADDGVVPVSDSQLYINCQDIGITKREELGLYTYLAKLTKKISALPEISSAQKEYIDLINKAIDQNAVHYIEYVM